MANYTILTSMVNDFSKKINHIANKCYKQGIPYTFLMSDPYDKVVEDHEGNSFVISVTDIELDIQFKFNGWKALGLIQRKDGITQCYLKTQELIQQYGNTDFHCDHCHKHVHRNSVIVLEHDNGERKVVGTSCVKEFTCGLDGNLIAQFNEFEVILAKRNSELQILLQGESLDDLPVSVFCEQNGSPIYNVERVVSSAVRIINAYGFEPSNSLNATWKYIHDTYKETHESDPEAVRAIAWIKSLSNDDFTKSSYLFNLRQIIDADYCTPRHFGLLASLIPSFRKEEAKRLQAERASVSNHVGNIGDRLSLTLTYTKSISYDSQFGGGYFHFFTDTDGNVFKWSTNKGMCFRMNNRTYSLEQGATVKLTGTIKDHDDYRGMKQTIITRCKYEVLNSTVRDDAEQETSNNNSSSTDLDALMLYWA